MNTIFSGNLLIKKITYISSSKIYCIGLYNLISYKVVLKYYNWISEDCAIFGFGVLNNKDIYLETVIPDLRLDRKIFSLFLISMNIVGLTKNKIELLSQVFGDDLYLFFFDDKFEEINNILNYEKDKLNIIIKKWQEIKIYCLLHIDLMKLGVSAKFIKKIYKIYKERSLKILKDNPYQMIESMGFGFRTVDQIALEFGIKNDNIIRIESAFLFILCENELNGSTYIEKNILYNQVKVIINILDENLLHLAFNKLIQEDKIVSLKNNYIGKKDSYENELYIFNFFNNNKKLNNNFNILYDCNLSNEQELAVIGAIENKYSAITGSAGTGKSTVVKAIYYIKKKNNQKIIVITPTGRASQRLQEIDNTIESMTIYKLLQQNDLLYKSKLNNMYLEYDHFIIDEVSMVDSVLLSTLLKSIHINSSVTLIGDVSQLTPIGIGKPFELLIKYEAISVFYLTKIFRQNEKSLLLKVAQDISNGKYPKISSSSLVDCYFKDALKENIINILIEFIDKYYDKKSNVLNLQIVTFLNRGLCGVNKLNYLIQNYLYKKYRENEQLIFGKFYKFDKVIVTKNNYNLNVRNGSIGVIIDGNNEEIIVKFENKEVVFSSIYSNIIELAYAINVYKSQGSEFENIIIFLYMEQYILLNKKALYTALTRAKKQAVILGEKKALYCAINNKNNLERNTFLELFF